ncbi:PDR/VanB family oxidoreductase [Schauerella aestuarii]|uniref:PDR/VanB family oxidoreductase n=1 Tax=Schauerella aestuarii TaxID=2511204 RepID=UPI0013708074|nr:PDR/VanB family oxidoreductase [Achromobacter aestuarii]MYZ45318.1 oxidoreductase [Achromobacter aestuarii]
MQRLTFVVREVRQESPLICSIRMVLASGDPLPAFGPGAHLKVQVPGLDEPRCYSLVQTDADAGAFAAPTEYRLGVRRDDAGGGGSRYMHALKPGDTLEAVGPKNDFVLHEAPAGEPAAILIAGGIGITPLASMSAALTAAGRAHAFHYCGRSLDQLAFRDELAALTGDALHLHPDDDASCAFDLNAILDAASPHQHLYVCGPKGLIDAVIAAAHARHWPDAHVHFELFSAPAPLAGDQPFEVELRESGMVLTVPADRTIVDVMEEAGCDPMVDCKRGECGVCQADVIEGIPDHRDYYLSDTERASGKVIQICISRAKSARLVLAL